MSEKLTVDSKFVGVPWKQALRNVTWRDTTNYAAGLQDMNPVYFDDEREGGVTAHPMFAVTCGWPLTKNIQDYVNVPWTRELMDRDVNYTEHIDWYRPLKPGCGDEGTDVIINPTIHAMISQRAGTNVVYRHDVTDRNGELYWTEYDGCMFRGVACVDGGKGELPKVPLTACTEPVWEASVFISRAQSYIYDACSGLIYGAHTSPRFARKVDLPDIIIVGSCTEGYAVRELINRELGGNPAGLKTLDLKFTAMVMPDTNVRIQLLERRESGGFIELFFQVLNEKGEIAIKRGYLKALK